MEKPVKIILGLLGGVALLALLLVAFIGLRGISTYEPKDPGLRIRHLPERVEHGRKLASVLCVECLADPETRPLTGK